MSARCGNMNHKCERVLMVGLVRPNHSGPLKVVVSPTPRHFAAASAIARQQALDEVPRKREGARSSGVTVNRGFPVSGSLETCETYRTCKPGVFVEKYHLRHISTTIQGEREVAIYLLVQKPSGIMYRSLCQASSGTILPKESSMTCPQSKGSMYSP